MRIVYVTLDDVNRFVMRRWARPDAIRVDCPAVNAPAASFDSADAVILDLDHLPEPFRAAWLERFTSMAAGGCVMVHGHNIADAEAAALRRRGVRVCRGRLRRGFFDTGVVEESRRQKASEPGASATGVGANSGR